jgi:polysaccharide chain length determinant protein (PEP-CTERM system associated)
MMEDFFDIRFLIGALKRRWWLIALPTVIGAALSVVIAYALPATYRSAATVVVESQQIPADLARSTVAADAEERVRLIQQRLTTRQNLLDLAGGLNVFVGRDDLSPTERVELMRESTEIASQMVGVRADSQVAAIQIAYSHTNPAVAAQVANALLTQLLEENVEQRNARAAETVGFFTGEVERLGAELDDLEARISSFKNENQDALPDSVGFRRNELAQLRGEMFERDTRSIDLQDRRRVIEKQIELGRLELDGVGGAGSSNPQLRELANLRSALTQQRAIYSETHPTVRALAARISALEESLTTVAPSPASDTAEDAGPVGESVVLLAEIERIDAQLERLETQAEIDAARLSDLEESLARTAQVELQLGSLEREYDVLQARYQQALVKRAEAEIGERLEVNRQAERFEVIEQPQIPEEPIAPNRVMIAGVGSALSLGLGFGLMVLAEMLNPALYTARDLERRLNLSPVVTIPYIRTRGEEMRRRWLFRLSVFGVLLLLPLALLLIDQYYLPLSVLIERVLERTGLATLISAASARFGG